MGHPLIPSMKIWKSIQRQLYTCIAYTQASHSKSKELKHALRSSDQESMDDEGMNEYCCIYACT